MFTMRTLSRCAAAGAVALVIAFAASTAAADIIDDWANVKIPPAPELKAVTLDGSTTAIIIMDMNQIQCAQETRCSATAPAIKRLVDAGRAAGTMFWYSLPGNGAKPSDVDQVVKGVTPREGEYEPINGPDKFRGSMLDDKLKARNIKTAIICGHSFQGVGIGTGTGLAVRGYNVVVPVDCLASNSNDPNVLYLEQYSVWHLAKAANGVANKVTLTRSTMVKFQ
jgi:nicotinamidase-related amidase